MKSGIIRNILLAMGLTAISGLVGCAAEDGTTQVGTASYDRLSPEELEQHIGDQQYINKLATPNVAIRLNMADDRQHRFALTRLKLAGKTAANSPQLFAMLDEQRREHLDRGFSAGLLPGAAYLADGTADLGEKHFIETASLGESTPEANDAVGTANSTYPNGTIYTYTDVTFADSSGFAIGDFAYLEEYGAGKNIAINTTGDPSTSNLKQFQVSSYKSEYTAAGFTNSYVFNLVGAAEPNTAGTAPQLCPLTDAAIDAPQDVVDNDGIITVCLNRTWPGDCDYDLTGNPQSVKMPLKGSVSVCSDHTFDVARIDALREALNNGDGGIDVGSIRLILTNVGGGCDVTDENALTASMAHFWNHVTVSADAKTVSWDLTGVDAVHFDDGCRQVQASTKLTMMIPLPLIDTFGNKYGSQITLSNNTARPDYHYKPIEVTNSCLAEGTMIQLAGGEQTAIEDITAGAQVFNPHFADTRALTVTDTAKGFETVPMVRVEDASGRILLMTEMHALPTVNRGMVQAASLRVGDVVTTVTGPSALVEVSREEYDGQVYNLKVGSDSEMANLGDDQTVMYANGILVGDGQIQAEYERRALEDDSDRFSRIPASMYVDYAMSLMR